MGLLNGIFNIVESVISIPTDILGITNTTGKRQAKEIALKGYADNKITAEEYRILVEYIDNM